MERCSRWHIDGIAAVVQRTAWLVVLLALALHILAAQVNGQPVGTRPRGEVRLLTINGVINPLTARYLERGLREATDAQAQVVVVRLNTPGGLESSMREMTLGILASPIPVVVYVAPSGARAASAGMFLTIAAHVAAMAPGTNIGAAHPVGIGGEKPDKVMSDKVTNDAAAMARSIADARGRNAKWAEKAVRESVSLTAKEALEQNVIDIVAPSLEELLRRIDGRQVTTATGKVTLKTARANPVERPMGLAERILLTLADPNIAYLLFTIGSIGIIAELYHPGSLFPGITGAICLILAFVSFGSLPINWAAVLLLLLAMALYVAELHTQGIGFLAVGGTIAFVLGSLMLFTPPAVREPTLPVVRVNPLLITLTTAAFASFFLVSLRAVMKTRRAPVTTGIEALIGRSGMALSSVSPANVAPRGLVRVDSEVWSAAADSEPIDAGTTVQVVGVEGVTLKVKRV
jgi:membrane-bound serine protease (ClpP class)